MDIFNENNLITKTRNLKKYGIFFLPFAISSFRVFVVVFLMVAIVLSG